MRRLLLVLIALLLPLGSALAIDVPTPAGWSEAKHKDDFVIFYQDDEKAHVRAFKGVTEMDATPEAVFKVVTDFEAHVKFMPFTKVSKIVERINENEIIGYQRISPPLVSDRDVYFHIKLTPGSAATGGVYRSEWVNVPDRPTTEGVVRMGLADGTWLFEPLDGGKRTRVTYTARTELGGAIPAWIANRSNVNVIPDIFKAIRGQLRK